MEQGWIKLHRKILENIFLMHDEKAFVVFVKLLMLVSRSKGEYATGRIKFAELLDMNPNTLYSVLVRLEKQHLINISSNMRYSVISICNWSRYQGDDNSLVNNPATTGQQLGNTLTRKKNKNIYIQNNFPELEPELTSFVEMRTAKRNKPTEHAIDLIVKKLRTMYSDNIEQQKASLNQSTERGYAGVFEVKGSTSTNKVVF